MQGCISHHSEAGARAAVEASEVNLRPVEHGSRDVGAGGEGGIRLDLERAGIPGSGIRD